MFSRLTVGLQDLAVPKRLPDPACANRRQSSLSAGISSQRPASYERSWVCSKVVSCNQLKSLSLSKAVFIHCDIEVRNFGILLLAQGDAMHCWESNQKVKNDLQRLPLNEIACCVSKARQLETGAGRDWFNADLAWRHAFLEVPYVFKRSHSKYFCISLTLHFLAFPHKKKTVSAQKPQPLVIGQKKFSNRHTSHATCNAKDWSIEY